MKVLIFGATGGVGLALSSQAIAAGHTVTILARNPTKLPTSISTSATVVKADAVLDPAAVASAVKGQDAILVSLGGNSLLFRGYDCSKGTDNILAAIKASEGPPPRVLICSSMGASESAPFIPGFVRWMLKHPLADKDVQEAAVRAATGVPYVIIRPTGLNNEEAKGPGSLAAVVGGALPTSQISRKDVAAFMLAQLSSDEFLGKAVGVSWKAGVNKGSAYVG
jgi:uncharacterized protein YbjT (DUF2867 family)